jgi:hypothetical protein
MSIEVTKEIVSLLIPLLPRPWYPHIVTGPDCVTYAEFDLRRPGSIDSFNFWVSFGNEDIEIHIRHERRDRDLQGWRINCVIADPQCVEKLVGMIIKVIAKYEKDCVGM